MRIGVPRELKNHEYRVGLTPESVRQLVGDGHVVLVERDAAEGMGVGDAEYRAAGAVICSTPEEIYGEADLIVKVKEPLRQERACLHAGQAIFTYLHLAPDPEQVRDLVASGCMAIAYETVTSASGGLPLLAPMSEVAGRMSIQVAAHFLERPHGGRGVLLPGVAGVAPARVVVLGAGTVGASAARVATGMGASVMVLNRTAAALARLSSELGGKISTLISAPEAVEAQLSEADAVIGAALVAGALAPKLVTRATLRAMRRGAVMVDVSIDQGGCFETSRPTTHADPVFKVDGVLHYCVTNMPGAVPRTSTYALNRATLPFVRELADYGIATALMRNVHLRNGLNVCRGMVTRAEVARAVNVPYVESVRALSGGVDTG